MNNANLLVFNKLINNTYDQNISKKNSSSYSNSSDISSIFNNKNTTSLFENNINKDYLFNLLIFLFTNKLDSDKKDFNNTNNLITQTPVESLNTVKKEKIIESVKTDTSEIIDLNKKEQIQPLEEKYIPTETVIESVKTDSSEIIDLNKKEQIQPLEEKYTPKTETTYDEKGNKIETFYDEKGNKIVINFINVLLNQDDGFVPIAHLETRYDINGIKTLERTYAGLNKIHNDKTYFENGQLKNDIHYNDNGGIFCFHSYDENGKFLNI